MMSFKKIFFTLLISVIFFNLFTKTTRAQGYFDCHWVDDHCEFKSHDCEDGYGPDDYCDTATEENYCNNLVVSCVETEEPPPASCAIEGQYCDASKPCCTSNLTCGAYSVCEPQASFQCNNDTGIDTAIGCISRDSIFEMTKFFVAWSIGIGGGIAFLLMIYAGFMMMTSSGDPRRLMAAKELFISAMAGLIMLVFSVYIIRLIGFDILGVL